MINIELRAAKRIEQNMTVEEAYKGLTLIEVMQKSAREFSKENDNNGDIKGNINQIIY
jgi:hypothetical protein